MAISSALVLYAVIWFICLFIMLPIRIRSQGESGKVVRGTPSSAPTNPMLKIKLKWTSLIALLFWIPVVGIVASGIISIQDIDFFGLWNDGQYG